MFHRSVQRTAASTFRIARPTYHNPHLLPLPLRHTTRHFNPKSQLRTFTASQNHNAEFAGQLRSFPSLVTQAVKTHPVSGGLIGLILLALLGSIGYITYEQIKIKNAFMAYPEGVREPLARAVFFHIWRDPERAFKSYREAVFKCQESGLHPLSNLVIGLKGQIALFLAEYNNVAAAVEVFEMMRNEGLEWLQENDGNTEVDIAERIRIVQKVEAMGLQLGDWYMNPSVNRTEEAEVVWVATLEMMLNERQKLKDNKVVDHDFTNDEMGMPMTKLGEYYAHTAKPDLALPLFLKSLEFCSTDSCQSVLIRANIASTLWNKAPLDKPPPNWPSFKQQAKMWAKSAVESYEKVPSGSREEACESGCWVAKTVLAVSAQEEGDGEAEENLKRDVINRLSQHQNSSWAQGARESLDGLLAKSTKEKNEVTEIVENKPGSTEQK